MYNPTEEQQHILNLSKTTQNNIMISALAGTGKSTTLAMIENAAPEKPILILAFNKKIADDTAKKVASTSQVRTFNGLGHRIWAKATRSFKPEPRKTADLFRTMIDEAPKADRGDMWDAFWSVIEAVGKAKSHGYIPDAHARANKRLADWPTVAAALDEEPTPEIRRWVDALLLRSITAAYAGTCDFDDQIYMPTLFAGTFPEFPLVMVDEYQDLNPINHAMIRKLAKHRLIGVGDPNQSIYAFRGANSNGMTEAVATYNMTECDLTLSFRCPEAVVRNVWWRVPKFRWSTPGGQVSDLTALHTADLPDRATFICRNNAPLYALAMRCLTAGIGVNVGGSDIGPRIVRQMKKLGPEDMSRAALLAAIEEWLAAKEDRGSKTAADTAACMRVFASHGANLGQAILYAEHLFKQDGQLHFTTGHKAKGLEYPTVFHLDPWLIGTTEQEKNLNYVISTRSSDYLATINSNDIEVQ